MKTLVKLMFVVAVAAAILLAPAVQAQAVVTEFTAHDGPPCTPISPGTYTEIRDENGELLQIHIRDRIVKCGLMSDDGRINGFNTITMSGNVDANNLGPVWGTSLWEPAEGGSWTTHYEGLSTPKHFPTEPGIYHFELHGVAQGHGPWEGMKAFYDAHAGQFAGTILDPHGG